MVQQPSGRLITEQSWYSTGHTTPLVVFERASEEAPVAVGVAAVAGTVGMKTPEAVVWASTGARASRAASRSSSSSGGWERRHNMAGVWRCEQRDSGELLYAAAVCLYEEPAASCRVNKQSQP